MGVSFNESINVENWPCGTLVKRFYSSTVSNSPEQPGNTTSDS